MEDTLTIWDFAKLNGTSRHSFKITFHSLAILLKRAPGNHAGTYRTVPISEQDPQDKVGRTYAPALYNS